MKLKLTDKRIYLSLFIFYAAVIFLLTIICIIEVISTPKLNSNSSIPELSGSLITNISSDLDNKENLTIPTLFDLSHYKFGKLEPFQKGGE